MPTVDKQIRIDRPADEVWNVVGDVGAISAWFPGLASSRAHDGKRVCELEGGAGTLVEDIVAYDGDARTYEYAITDAPMPVESHHARVEVHDEGDASLLIWRTEVEPASTAEAMDSLFDAALAELKQHLES